jgi:hypothetical protein
VRETHSEAQHVADAHSVETPAAEPMKAEAKQEAAAPVEDVSTPAKAAAEDVSEPVKAEPAKVEPVKAEAVKGETAKESSALVKTEKTSSEMASTKSGPGSALITIPPAAARFEAHQHASETPFAAAPDRRKGRFVLYGSQAAVLAFLLGCGYLVSGQILHGDAKPEAVKSEAAAKPEPAVKTAAAAKPESTIKSEAAIKTAAAPVAAQAPAASAAVEAAERAERAELRHVTQEMSEEIRSLKASLDALRNQVAQSQSAEEIHGLKKGLDGVKSGLEAAKTETNASIAQLTAKLEHAQHEQAAKLQQVLEKAEHVEQRPNTAALATGSLPPAAPATAAPAPRPQQSAAVVAPPLPPMQQASAADAQKKPPQSISNWVVRDVYEGIALVEGPGGAFEVMQGENVPGLGTVKSIERRGNGWVVVTNHGNVDYARE